MALEAGSIYVKLAGFFQRDEFEKYDRAVDQARSEARTPIEQKLGADTAPLAQDLSRARTQMSAWSATKSDAKVGVDEGFFSRAMAGAREKFQGMVRTFNGEARIKVDLDTAAAEAKIAVLKAELAALSGGEVTPGVGLGGLSNVAFSRVMSGRVGAVPGGLLGIRGPGGGTSDNPVVVTLEAARFTGLGARAAEVAYPSGTEQTPTAGTITALGGPQRGAEQPMMPAQEPAWATQLGRNLEHVTRPSAVQGPAFAHRMGTTNIQGRSQEQIQLEGLANATAALKVLSTRREIPIDVNATQALAQIAAVRAAEEALNKYGAVKLPTFTQDRIGRVQARGDGGQFITVGPPAGGMGGGGAGGGDGGGIVPPAGGDGGGGSDSGGGGFRDSAASFLFGMGARRTGGRFFGGRYNPLQFGIHGPLGFVGGAVGLGPEHLVGAGLAVGGSAVGGAAGAGVTALGALGQFAVGGGSDIAVMKSTIADTQTLYKSYTQLQTAITRYGAGSRQAAQAQAALNAQMAELGGGVGVKAEMQLAKAASALNDQWDKATQNARVQAVNILNQVLGLGRAFVPKVAEAARENLTIINKSIQPLFQWLEGPHGMKIFNDLENRFRSNIKPAVDAFSQAIEFLLKVMDDASQYTGKFTQSLDHFFTRLNNMPAEELSAKIAKLHQDFALWEDLIKNLSKDLYDFFKAGSGEGNDLVVRLDELLKRWGEWERSARGQTAIHTFFENRKEELMAVLTIVGQVAKMFGQVWVALQPLVPAITLFARSVSSALGATLVPLVSVAAKGLGDILRAFVSLGERNGPLGSLGPLFKDAIIAPLGVALISMRLFGASATRDLLTLRGRFGGVRTAITGIGTALKLAFGGDFGGAMNSLKDTWSKITGKGPGTPAETMQGAIVAGSKEGAGLIQEAIVAGHKEGAGLVKTAEVEGGGEAATEIKTAEVEGGAVAGTEEGLGGAGGGAVNTAEKVAGGAGAGGLLARGGSILSGGAASAFLLAGGPEALAGLLLNQFGPKDPAPARNAPFTAREILTGTANDYQRGFGERGPNPSYASELAAARNIPSASDERLNIRAGVPGVAQGAQRYTQAFLDAAKLVNPAKESSKALYDLQQRALALSKLPDITAPQRASLLKLITTLGGVPLTFNQVSSTINKWYRNTGKDLNSLKDDFSSNMRLIAHSVGLRSDEGRRLMATNVNKMMDAVKNGMQTGRINVNAGMTAINNALKNGVNTGAISWDAAWHDMFGTVTDLYSTHKINTKTFMSDMRGLFNQGTTHIKNDTQQTYQNMFNNLKTQLDNGEITQQQFNARVKQLDDERNKNQSTDLTQFATNMYNAMVHSGNVTLSGAQAIAKELNSLLGPLGAKPIPNPTGVSVALTTAGPSVTSQGAAAIKRQFGGTSHAGGGTLPGAEYGYSDHMTLVDPMGRPRAKMAGDEGILTRHQMPVVDYALNVAKAMGALPFGSLDEVWRGVNRPHGYEQGGALPSFMRGGSAGISYQGNPTGSYVFPFPKKESFSWNRIDQGQDLQGPPGGPVLAIGPGVVSVGHDAFSGFGPFYPVETLSTGPWAGQSVYYGHVKDTKTGNVRAGDIIGYTQSAANQWTAAPAGWLEFGFTTALGHGIQGQGAAVAPMLHALAAGHMVSGTGGGVGPSWTDIHSPRVRGQGKLAEMVQAGLDRATKAANAYGQKQVGALGGGLGNVPQTSGPVEHQMYQAGIALGFNKIAIAGLIGNAYQESSINPSLNQAGGRGLFSWNPGANPQAAQVQLGNVGQQMALAAQAIGPGGIAAMNRSGSPAAAAAWFMNNFEHPAGWAANLAHRVSAANAAFAAGYASGGPLGGHGQMSFVNKAGVPDRDVKNFQRAAIAQSRQIGRHWHTPTVGWGGNGSRMVLLPPHDPALRGKAGYHTVVGGVPTAFVSSQGRVPWTVVASHELAEMLVDPWLNRSSGGMREEVSDPVKGLWYPLMGVQMADWVTPSWFNSGRAPYDWLNALHGPHTTSAKGYTTSSNAFNTGGPLHHARRSRSPYSTATHHQAKTVKPPKPASVLKFVGTAPPGLGKYQGLIDSFATDDRKFARYDHTFNQDQQLFQLYDAGDTGTLPQRDLQVLVGLQEQEWDLYWNEYKRLPKAIAELTGEANVLIGNTAGYRWVKNRQHHPGQHGGTGGGGAGPHAGERYRYVAGSGIDATLQQLNTDQNTVTLVQNDIRQSRQHAAATKHAISARARAAANTYARQMNHLADAIIADSHKSIGTSYQIANLTTQLAGAYGNRYATLQNQIQNLQAQRRAGSASAPLYAELTKTRIQARIAAQRYSNEGFEQAWAAEVQRFNLENKLHGLQQDIKKLTDLLKAEQKRLSYLIGPQTGSVTGGGKQGLDPVYPTANDPTGGIIKTLQDRLTGGVDGSSTAVTDTLESIGYNILSLAQEGATVPQSKIDEITKLFSDLGVTLPVDFGAGGVGSDTAGLQAMQDFQNFQSALANIFGSYGSNFVPTGVNPFGTLAGLDAGTQYYGAAAGGASGGSYSSPSSPTSNHTEININQNFAAGPPAPVTYAAGLKYELGAQI